MNLITDPKLETLKSLSRTLGSNISTAEIEAKRSKEQLDTLLFSKGLVDESLRAITGSSGSLYQTTAEATIFPTGSMLLPICQQFNATPPGTGRSFICDQIQTTIRAGVSAFIVANPSELQADLVKLQEMLINHNEELIGLEQRLSSRFANYSMHLETMLRGALESYRDAGNSLRFVNAGTALRELLREFLAEVAPDNNVKNAVWFIPDQTSKNGVTRRHRIDFAIFKNLTKDKFPESFAKQSDAIATELLKDIGNLSALTHVTEQVLDKSYLEAAPLFAAVMQRFILLISAIESASLLVEEDVTVEIQTNLDSVFIEEFFDELDILSSHTRPQGASDIEITGITFDESWIQFEGTGSVDCDLQWGSDGDVRRGDGAEASMSFPFSFSGKAAIGDLSQIKIDRNDINIDTSSFYE